MTTESSRETYRAAYEEWQQQLDQVHKVLLDGELLPPPRLKGLLNREARAKERYDEARLRLLGIADGDSPFDDGGG